MNYFYELFGMIFVLDPLTVWAFFWKKKSPLCSVLRKKDVIQVWIVESHEFYGF